MKTKTTVHYNVEYEVRVCWPWVSLEGYSKLKQAEKSARQFQNSGMAARIIKVTTITKTQIVK